MTPGRPWRDEARAQLRLALPVIVVQVGLVAMGVVDGAFMGRVSAAEYAAVSAGHSYTFVFLGFGLGTLAALDPLVSQAWGARELESIARSVQRGIVIALGLSLFVIACCLPARELLARLGQPASVIPSAATFVRISMAGVPAFLLFVAMRQSLQAMHCLRPLVFVIVLANGLNAFLDWVLIWGNLGAPALGAAGCAWATVVARWAMALALPFVAGERLLDHLWPIRAGAFEGAAIGRMLKLGIPIGLQFALEIGAFAAVLFLMGRLGEVELAGHQVALSLASTSFMVPLAISMAAAVRVGNEIGRGNAAAVRRACAVALAGGAGVMLFSAALFLLAPYPLARFFTVLPDVLAMAVVLIPIAGLFQVFDGLQGVALGCLRGMADTRAPFLIHLIGFWGIAIPISFYLAFERELGARGLWWGLVWGLFAVAVVQVARVRTMLARGVARVVVEERSGGDG